METVEEIERAIESLTPKQREKLFAWLDQSIDTQLKADLDAGRIRRAVADHRAGNRIPAILPCNSRQTFR